MRGKESHTSIAIGSQQIGQGSSGVVLNVGPSRRKRSTVPSTDGEPRFTGRAGQFRAIDEALAAHKVVIVQGPPGMGKSRLAKEYAHAHAANYPGGIVFIQFGDGTPPLDLARLLRDFGQADYPGEPFEDQCRRALGLIGAEGCTLVIYDAVSDEETLRAWLPRMGLDWQLVVTSTFADWSSTWRQVPVGALPEPEALELVESILGGPGAGQQFALPLVRRAGGVTIELCASALAAEARIRKGRPVEVAEALGKPTTSSFDAAWSLLPESGRFLMRVACTYVSTRVPAVLLRPVLESVGWTASQVSDGIDALRARGLAAGQDDDLEIHQLVASFVRGREKPLIAETRRALFDGFLKIAEEFTGSPGSIELRGRLLAHELRLDAWYDVATGAGSWHHIGGAIYEAGQFQEALSWFERAVAEKEPSDVDGRIDHASLGSSLYHVGYCHSSLGRYEQAVPWYERAVAEKEQGEIHGRIDHESLGRSLHQVGYYHSRLGQYEQAVPWYERAVAEKEQGDTHGRVDHQSLSISRSVLEDARTQAARRSDRQ